MEAKSFCKRALKAAFYLALTILGIVGIVLHMVGGIGSVNVDRDTAIDDGLSTVLDDFISCHDLRAATDGGEMVDDLVQHACQTRQASILFSSVFASVAMMVNLLLALVYLWKRYASLGRIVYLMNIFTFGLTCVSIAVFSTRAGPVQARLLSCINLTPVEIAAIDSGNVTTLPAGARCVEFSEDDADDRNLESGQFFRSRFGIFIGGVVCSAIVSVALLIFLSFSANHPDSEDARSKRRSSHGEAGTPLAPLDLIQPVNYGGGQYNNNGSNVVASAPPL